MSSSASEPGLLGDDSELLSDGFAEGLRKIGLDSTKVDEFIGLLRDCNVTTRGALRLFADDCLLYRQIRSLADHVILQQDLQRLEAWAAEWGMSFNAKKCYIMSTSNASNFLYKLNDHVLEKVHDSPYLGLTISDDLKWGPHINKCSKKANSSLGFLKRNLRHCPQNCKRLAYISLVRSIVEYGGTIWDPYLQKDVDCLENVQRRAARFISSLSLILPLSNNVEKSIDSSSFTKYQTHWFQASL